MNAMMSRLSALGGAQHVDAADVRHPDVREQQIDAFLFEDRDRLGAVGGEQHVEAVAAQHDAQHVAHRRLIVHDEDARLGSALGRHRWPGSGLLDVSICSSAGRPDSYDRLICGCRRGSTRRGRRSPVLAPRIGSRTVTTVPAPTVDETLMVPL